MCVKDLMGDSDSHRPVSSHSSLIEKLRKSHCNLSPESDFASALYGLSGHVGQLGHHHHGGPDHGGHRGLLNNNLVPSMDSPTNHHFSGKCRAVEWTRKWNEIPKCK